MEMIIIRVKLIRNAILITTFCCYCITTRSHASSLESERWMKGKRMKDNHNIPPIFATTRSNGGAGTGSSSTRIQSPPKSRGKNRLHKAQSLKMTWNEQPSETAEGHVWSTTAAADEIFSRQKEPQPTTPPFVTPFGNDNNNNSNGKKAAPSLAITFTLSPIAAPTDTPTTTTIPPTLVTTTDLPTAKPLLSVPLTVPAPSSSNSDPVLSIPVTASVPVESVLASSEPTTFFVGVDPTVQPSPVLVIDVTDRPIVANTNGSSTGIPTLLIPGDSNTNTTINTNSTDAVLGSDQSAATAGTISSRGNETNGKRQAGPIIGIVLAVIASMIVSVTVLMVRHRYVQKHGSYTSRKRRKQQEEQGTADITNIEDDLPTNVKTVHIITNHNDNDDDVSPDRTYEIHLADDDDDDDYVHRNEYSQESSFMSTSGGEEIESDLDKS